MNYVPLEFLDSVASTLRDLPFKAELCTTHEEFVSWSEAMNNARSKRVVYTMQITEINGNLDICFFSSAVLNLQDFLKLDRNCTQIHQIKVYNDAGYVGLFISKPKVSLECEFSEIVDAIKPLANWTSLVITTAQSVHNQVFRYMSLLGKIDFSEITQTKRSAAQCPNLDAEFMTKQMVSGLLTRITIWPQMYSVTFAEEVEKFLVSQQYSERLLKSPCESVKDTFFYCSDYKEDFVRKREDGVQVNFTMIHGLRHSHYCRLSFKRC